MPHKAQQAGWQRHAPHCHSHQNLPQPSKPAGSGLSLTSSRQVGRNAGCVGRASRDKRLLEGRGWLVAGQAGAGGRRGNRCRLGRAPQGAWPAHVQGARGRGAGAASSQSALRKLLQCQLRAAGGQRGRGSCSSRGGSHLSRQRLSRRSSAGGGAWPGNAAAAGLAAKAGGRCRCCCCCCGRAGRGGQGGSSASCGGDAPGGLTAGGTGRGQAGGGGSGGGGAGGGALHSQAACRDGKQRQTGIDVVQ